MLLPDDIADFGVRFNDPRRDFFVNMSLAAVVIEEVLGNVRKRAVTDIMQKRSVPHESRLFRREIELLGQAPCNMCCAKAMLESRVSGAGIHKVSER